MADVKKRHCFVEVRVTEDGRVLLHTAVTEGEYTTQELAVIINRLTAAKILADDVKRSLRASKKKAKNVNK